MSIQEIISAVCALPADSEALLAAQFSPISFPRGHVLLRPDKLERQVYFIGQGAARAYAFLNDQEVTFWFGMEGAPLLSMKSYVFGEPSYEYVELLEDCELYGASVAGLKALFRDEIHLANWGRAFAERELVKTEERLISRQTRSAEIRYRELLSTEPELLQRVQLRHIASYLGITAVSLSRIRAAIS